MLENRLREIRKYRGLTQAKIGKKLKMTQQQYSEIENNYHDTLVTTLEKICLNLNVSAEYLLGLTNNYIDKPIIKKHNIYYNVLLKETREHKDVKLKEISNALNLKYQQYARYEEAVNIMPVKYFKKACEYLNISPDYLLGFTKEQKTIDCD